MSVSSIETPNNVEHSSTHIHSWSCNHNFERSEEIKDVSEILNSSEMQSLSSLYQNSLKKLLKDVQEDPSKAIQRASACWDPSTDPTTMSNYMIVKNEILNSVNAHATNADFVLTNRWTATATDGGGLGQGDVTTLTWSYPANGTVLVGNCSSQPDPPGGSNFITYFNGIFGGPTTPGDFTTAPWHTIFVDMFDNWANVTGLNFVYEPNDDGAQMGFNGSPGAIGVRGDLRIGGAFVNGPSGVLACNYFPAFGGDMIIDTGDNFYANNPGVGTFNVLSHEVGHGLGLRHSCPSNNSKLMEPFINTNFMGPQEDDILAGNRHYGDKDENNDNAASATPLGAITLGGSASRMQVSIDDDLDADFYSFTSSAAAIATVTLTPTGTTYLAGAQNANGSCQAGTNFNALAESNLDVEIIAADGVTVLPVTTGGNLTGAGVMEVAVSNLPTAGTFYARVTGSANAAQMYNIEVALAPALGPVNQDCNMAIGISCGQAINGTNTGSTANDGLDQCDPGVAPQFGVYYTFVGTGQSTTISTTSSTFDVGISIYTGNCGALTCIGGNNNGGGGLEASFTFNSTVGTTYYIYVDGFAGAQGDFTLNVNCCDLPTAVCSNFNAVLSATNPGTVTLVPSNIDGGSTAPCGGLTLSIEAGDQTVFTCADIGPSNQVTVTLEATDMFGNTSTCDATVTTLDQTPPTAGCISPVVAQLDANGVATISVADVRDDATTTDNCGVLPGGQLTQTAFNCAELGDNMVTLTVTDVNGLSGNCTATVTVADAIDPVAVCQDITIPLDAAGNAATTAAALDGGTSDNCSFTLAANPTAFTCANVGANNVTLTATDPAGNTDNCTAVVTIEDNTAPVANCQNISVDLDANGMVSIIAEDVNDGSTDACGPLTFAVNQEDFDCTNIGGNTVTLTVTDVNGNVSSCSATVTVVDPIPATILCRPNVNTVNDPGICGADVILLPPLVIEENCSITNVARSPAMGFVFPTGTTLVTWTLTDAGGNDTQCLQNVTINDTEVPVIDCGNSFIAYTSWNNCGYPSSLLEGATATDNCGVVSLTDDAPNFFPPGQYMVNYTATDAAGNEATCMQWVKIFDTTQPKLVSCPSDIEIEANTANGANVNWSLPVGMDNCPGPIILVEANGFAPGDLFPIGETEISYRLYDQNGQFVECEFTITVTAMGSPLMALTCMDDLDISLNNAIGMDALGWNPPLMNTNCEQCDVLASDDFQVIGTLAGHQYYTQTADEMTFDEALAYAENIGATVAILEDKKEVPMIENELPEGKYFIGLIDAEGTGDFKWINGDEFVASDFGILLENDTEEPATVILNEEGEWEVVSIADAKANFVFEKVCVELEMITVIDDEEINTVDDELDLADAGEIAAITYTAVDECGNTASCGFEIAFVAETVAYCEPTGIATDEENPYFIDSFSLNDYTVETGDDEGYGDHLDEHFLFTSGEVLDMHAVFAGPNIDELPMYCRIWMDLNNDGDFFDENELVMQGVDIGEAINELTIPNVNQSVENTVMRIAISRLTYAESCGDFLNGEVEDYTINIVSPQSLQIGIGNGLDVTTANNLGANMFVYPNPAHDELFVKLNNMESETAILRMYNSVGQLVATQKVATASTIRLDVSSYTSGLYSVIAEADGEVQLTQKFMVERR